ncbi:hypothetical protein MOQ_002639 [Trypanosoma cruzi marinkellei]|uniref:Transmembrane protein n=1 Tax=Trypanosoma cruzi marinkellei TaxID=85056 RepID=K2N1V6_TRYCR|nr:hypothetical protein MOQ_002639 [Trypanosoma cruzi marinkellei]
MSSYIYIYEYTPGVAMRLAAGCAVTLFGCFSIFFWCVAQVEKSWNSQTPLKKMWNALSCLEGPPLVEPKKVDPPAAVVLVSACEVPPAVSEAHLAAATQTDAVVMEKKSDFCEEPPTQADGATLGDASTEWDAFSRRRLGIAFHRGAAVLPGFPVLQRELRPNTPHDSPSRQVVDVDLWNSYWSAFSDRFAAQIDDVQEYLKAHDGESERRRVLVAASLDAEPYMEAFKFSLTAYARSFGALEHVSRERCVVMLQFTSPRSADIFAAWAFSLTLEDIFAEADAPQQASANCQLLVRLISHDAGKITSTLNWGSNIVFSTPFVESLFKGVFDAVSVTYHDGSFLILFASVLAAKTALHCLQRSLLEVFGTTLSFSEQQPGLGGRSFLMDKFGSESNLPR